MPAVNSTWVTIGGPESPVGTPAARTHALPMRGPATIAEKAEKLEDPAITASNLSSGDYPIALNVEGSLPLTPRPCGGFGKLLHSVLGSQAAGVQVGALIRLRYTGSQASCKLVADGTGNSLTSSIGARGAETPDAAFGAAGVIDFDETAYDTLDEVVAAIAGYADYECEKIFGADAFDVKTNKVIGFTAREGKNTWCWLWFSSATSGVYAHASSYQLAIDEHPAYSIQADGFGDNYLFNGCLVDALSFKGASKGFVEADATILGFGETGSQVASALVLPDVDPMIFQQGGFAIGAKEFNFIRDLNLTLEGGHNKEGYGMGSLSRQYHEKGKYKGNGTATIRLDADSYALRAPTKTGGRTALSTYFTGKELAAGIPELTLIELPYISYSGWDPKENNGTFDCSFAFGVQKPKGIIYNNPITVTILTLESGTY